MNTTPNKVGWMTSEFWFLVLTAIGLALDAITGGHVFTKYPDVEKALLTLSSVYALLRTALKAAMDFRVSASSSQPAENTVG